MLSYLQLKNYRSHKDLSVRFADNTNVIIGQNGAGKTNILEAVLVMATGKSYRASDIDLIHYDAPLTHIEADINDRRRRVSIQKKDTKTDKSFFINDKVQKRLSFKDMLPVVLFEPNFMQIIARGPDSRREYIDTFLSRINARYSTLLNQYKRVLTQRNALLKSSYASTDQLFVWDVKLSQLGGSIANSRIQLLKDINSQINTIYSNLSAEQHIIETAYITKNQAQDYTNNLLKNLQKNIAIDKERGFTGFGPHRDDIAFFINHKDASLSASRGEARTLLLAMKICELYMIEKSREQKPLLLLDDVFSELDETRQTKLIEYFNNYQVIITTTNITPLMRGVSGRIIEIDRSNI